MAKLFAPKAHKSLSGTCTKESTPSRLNPWPTAPRANETFANVPLLPPTLSMALPLACHQLIMLAGGSAQTVLVGCTVIFTVPIAAVKKHPAGELTQSTLPVK